MTEPWEAQVQSLGGFIRSQRKLADLSLRQLSELAGVSNPYLSQIERGLHEPSVRVVRSIARALNLSAKTLLDQAGVDSDDLAEGAGQSRTGTEIAIRTDPVLTEPQKDALLAVYRGFVQAAPPQAPGAASSRASE